MLEYGMSMVYVKLLSLYIPFFWQGALTFEGAFTFGGGGGGGGGREVTFETLW